MTEKERFRELMNIGLRTWATNVFYGHYRKTIDEDMCRLMDLCEEVIGLQDDRPERTR